MTRTTSAIIALSCRDWLSQRFVLAGCCGRVASGRQRLRRRRVRTRYSPYKGLIDERGISAAMMKLSRAWRGRLELQHYAPEILLSQSAGAGVVYGWLSADAQRYRHRPRARHHAVSASCR